MAARDPSRQAFLHKETEYSHSKECADLRQQIASLQTEAAEQQRTMTALKQQLQQPMPNLLIRLGQLGPGLLSMERFVFEVAGTEAAQNIVLQPWRQGDHWLACRPNPIPVIHPNQPLESVVFLYHQSGDAHSAVSLVDYVGKQPLRQIEIRVVFENFRGVRFERIFTLQRAFLSDTLDSYPGRLELLS